MASRERPIRVLTRASVSGACSPRKVPSRLRAFISAISSRRRGSRAAHPQTVISQRLGEDPADAEHDHGPEDRVARESGHEFAFARQDGLDEDAFELVPGLVLDGRTARSTAALVDRLRCTRPRSVLWSRVDPRPLRTTG